MARTFVPEFDTLSLTGTTLQAVPIEISVPATTTASLGDAVSLRIRGSFRTKYRPGGHSFGPLEGAGEAKSTSATDATPAAPRSTLFAVPVPFEILILSCVRQRRIDGLKPWLEYAQRRRHGIDRTPPLPHAHPAHRRSSGLIGAPDESARRPWGTMIGLCSRTPGSESTIWQSPTHS